MIPKDKGGVKYLTYGTMGRSQMSMRGPIKLSTTFLVFFPITYFCQNVVELVNAWGKSMGKEIRIGQRPIFGKSCSDFLGKKNAQKRMPFCHASTFFHFPHHSPSRWGFWEQLEFFLCFSFHDFGCWLHFSHGLEVVFVVPGTGLSSSRFGRRWCIFPFTFL